MSHDERHQISGESSIVQCMVFWPTTLAAFLDVSDSQQGARIYGNLLGNETSLATTTTALEQTDSLHPCFAGLWPDSTRVSLNAIKSLANKKNGGKRCNK